MTSTVTTLRARLENSCEARVVLGSSTYQTGYSSGELFHYTWTCTAPIGQTPIRSGWWTARAASKIGSSLTLSCWDWERRRATRFPWGVQAGNVRRRWPPSYANIWECFPAFTYLTGVGSAARSLRLTCENTTLPIESSVFAREA